MKYSLWLSLILLWQVSSSQQCDCRENFHYMKEKVRKNYVGFTDKVPLLQKNRFDHFTDSLEELAATANNTKCLSLMRTWLSFFKDPHTSIAVKNDTVNKRTVREIFSLSEKVNLTEQTFESYLDSNKRSLDPIEGIWEDERQTYRIGFIRDRNGHPDQFIGFILKADSVYWMPGQVKARIRRTGNDYVALYFLTHDHSTFTPPIILGPNRLSAGIFGRWCKRSRVIDDNDTCHFESPLTIPSFRILDDHSCLLIIPGSGLDDKKIVDSIIRTNEPAIQQHEHLIIDLRNNMGGSILTFEKLIPLIYTQPFINRGASVLATDDNIQFYYAQYDLLNISDSMKNVFKKEAADLKKHEGGMYELWHDDTIRLDKSVAYPKRVSIIINEYCASSAELFLLQAKQSTKVVIFGKHSMGAVDYSDAVTMQMPCSLFSLRYATSRTNRLPQKPLDNIGIQPDIEIPDNIVNWIEFVRLKNHSL